MLPLAQRLAREAGAEVAFFGGYPGAERQMAAFSGEGAEVEFPIEGPRRSEASAPREARIEAQAYLTTMPVHRYLKDGPPVRRDSVRTGHLG